MNAKRSTERNQDSRRQDSRQRTELDNCYGEIGISAVSAAVRQCEHKGEHKGERREPRRVPYDRD
jgi:hypothetical protein